MSKIFRCLLCLFLAGCSVSEGQYAFVSDRPLKLSNLTGKGARRFHGHRHCPGSTSSRSCRSAKRRLHRRR